MLSTLIIVLPIFALIFAGWLTRRIGVLGPHATTELNRFVVYLALPALLIFAVTVAFRMRRPRHLAGLYYEPRVIATDKLRSYGVAQRQLLPGVKH